MFNSQLSKARHAVARCYEPFCPRDFAFKLKKSSYAGSYLPRTGFANHLETLPKNFDLLSVLEAPKDKIDVLKENVHRSSFQKHDYR